jgi:hypothetical protein
MGVEGAHRAHQVEQAAVVTVQGRMQIEAHHDVSGVAGAGDRYQVRHEHAARWRVSTGSLVDPRAVEARGWMRRDPVQGHGLREIAEIGFHSRTAGVEQMHVRRPLRRPT